MKFSVVKKSKNKSIKENERYTNPVTKLQNYEANIRLQIKKIKTQTLKHMNV